MTYCLHIFEKKVIKKRVNEFIEVIEKMVIDVHTAMLEMGRSNAGHNIWTSLSSLLRSYKVSIVKVR
jgi:hypothetical protein